MRKFNYVVFLLMAISLVALLGSVSMADSSSAYQYSAKVRVSISANDSIKGQVESYIKRELRSLQDVILVDERADWELSIIVMEAKNKAGNKIGAIISAMILPKFNNELVLGMLREESKSIGAALIQNLYLEPSHWLRIGSDDDIKHLCVELIADFDSEKLETQREVHRTLMKIIEENKN